ncbi:unnamed protein product, partial [Lampetra fluviatilis]
GGGGGSSSVSSSCCPGGPPLPAPPATAGAPSPPTPRLALAFADSQGELLPLTSEELLRSAVSRAAPLLRLVLQRSDEVDGSGQGGGSLPRRRRGFAVLRAQSTTSQRTRPHRDIGQPLDFRPVCSVIDVDLLPASVRRVRLHRPPLPGRAPLPLGFFIRAGGGPPPRRGGGRGEGGGGGGEGGGASSSRAAAGGGAGAHPQGCSPYTTRCWRSTALTSPASLWTREAWGGPTETSAAPTGTWGLSAWGTLLGVAMETLGVATETLEVATETLGVVTETLGVETETLGVVTETLGVAMETLGVATETRRVTTETLGVAME